jgi:hypothetical protein
MNNPRLIPLRTLTLGWMLCLPLAHTAAATPIVAFSGPITPFGGFGGLGIGVARVTQWDQTISVSDAVITADLSNFPGGATEATAYLTTSIGPGTTPAQEIAHATVQLPDFSPGVLHTVTLFTGLNLPPSQYYLVMTSAAGIWQTSDSSAFTRDGIRCDEPPNCAVTVPGFPFWQMFATVGNVFPPAETFTPFSFGFGVMHFSVDGQLDQEPPPLSPVPEPSSFALALSGLVIAVRRLRRR